MPSDTRMPSGDVLAFGPYRLLPLQRIVSHGETPLLLGSRAREILVALVEHAGEVVEKRELLRRVWPNMIVEEGTLRVHITALRKALRKGDSGTRYIESVTGRGYRFAVPVMPVQELTHAQVKPLAPVNTLCDVPQFIKERRPLLAFVHVDTASLAGMRQLTGLMHLPAVEEIHSVTGESAMLLKVRTRDSRELDQLLERVYAIDGFIAQRSYIALSTYLERGPGVSNE